MTGIWAKTILRSRNAAARDKVLSTLLVRLPTVLLAEFNTHQHRNFVGFRQYRAHIEGAA